MPDYKYLLIGGGMTADAAAWGIREVDREGSIGLISTETHAPYNRPPLSKGLWKGKPLSSIWRKTEKRNVTMHLGRTATAVDPKTKQVTDDQAAVYHYEKLLLAIGGTPRHLPYGGDHIIYFRTLDDYERLRAMSERGQHFVVIGAGFIGSEIAAALAMNGKRVTMLFPEPAIGARNFPADLAQFLNGYYREKGVELCPGEVPVDVQPHGEKLTVRVRTEATSHERTLDADGCVAGIGIQPNLELARAAGLKVENGILVDRALRTSQPEIFAAGDVALFENPALGRRLRVEHEDNAVTMGRMAGQSMAGRDVKYDHLPYFYSDLFDLGYEAVGELDARLETVADWQEPHRKGVVYYLRGGRVRGVLLWNVWEQVDAARALIAEPRPFRPEDLKGRLPAS